MSTQYVEYAQDSGVGCAVAEHGTVCCSRARHVRAVGHGCTQHDTQQSSPGCVTEGGVEGALGGEAGLKQQVAYLVGSKGLFTRRRRGTTQPLLACSHKLEPSFTGAQGGQLDGSTTAAQAQFTLGVDGFLKQCVQGIGVPHLPSLKGLRGVDHA